MLTPEDVQKRTIDPGDLFKEVDDRVRDVFSRGKAIPIVIIDLDDTLLDKRPRVMKVLSDLIMDQNPEIPLTDDVRAKIANIKPRTMNPNLEVTLREVGVDDDSMIQWMLREYKKKTELDHYIMFDLPVPGSVDFIKALSTSGAMTVYLAGERNMDVSKFGTERSISMYELPAPRGEVGALFMNDKEAVDELEFKRNLLKPLNESGQVVAVFDNEPVACNMFKEAYPDAIVTMLDSFRTNDDDLADGVHVIKNFLR